MSLLPCWHSEHQTEVGQYCSKLIRALGPRGFILHSGCDIPMDAQLANVQAMVSAVKGA